MPQRRSRQAAACSFAAALVLCAGTAVGKPAQPANAELAERRSDLGDLRERIESLRKDIAASESSRTDAADQLRDSERSISELQRDLRELADKRSDLQSRVRELGGETKTLESDLAAQRERLGRLLVRQYMHGSPDTVRLMLSGENPNQVARDLHYLNVVAQARSRLLKDIEASLGRQRNLAEQTRQQAAALAEVEAQQRQQHAQLTKQRDARKQLLARLSAHITTQRKEVGALQRDEQRLARLIDRLSKLVAARPPRPRPEAPQKPRSDAPATARTEAPPPEVRELPSASQTGAFSRLRGQLRLPVAGALAGRFGASREGGGTWKGLFIRAAAGSDVRAVAAGQVVFADWMRGFGNLLILDHGEGYLSIYGYNDALLRQVGDEVRSGDRIANVGNSGGHPETGLYFELRHQGRALDPLQWAKVR